MILLLESCSSSEIFYLSINSGMRSIFFFTSQHVIGSKSSGKNQSGWINQACVVLTPLSSSLPVTGFELTTFRSWTVFATRT